jgi:hypothetical protein
MKLIPNNATDGQGGRDAKEKEVDLLNNKSALGLTILQSYNIMVYLGYSKVRKILLGSALLKFINEILLKNIYS